MGLKRTVAPTGKLLTQEELRTQVSLMSLEHDQYLDALLARATAKAERETRRAFLTQTWRLTLDDFRCHKILLPRPPLQSVTSVTYIDENGTTQTLNSSLYRVATESQPGFVTPAYDEVWPAARCIAESVTITYVAGYGDDPASVPEDARHLVALLVAEMFANRGDQEEKMSPSIRWLIDGLKTGVMPGWYKLGD